MADRPYRQRADGLVTSEMLPFFGTAQPTETSLAPRVWVILGSAAAAGGAPTAAPALGGGRGGDTPTQRLIASVVDRPEAHGIRYTLTTHDITFSGERFKIASNALADREYQGTHKTRTLTGAREPTEQTMLAGSWIIPMDQPLARLAFILFDPRSDDGFMFWNILDPVLGLTLALAYVPVLRSGTDVHFGQWGTT